MKKNWRTILLCILEIFKQLLAGAAGGAIASMQF